MLGVREEEVFFILPDEMKHTLDHDDQLYFTDETNMVIYDCVQEVLVINLLIEYLEELYREEGEEKSSST